MRTRRRIFLPLLALLLAAAGYGLGMAVWAQSTDDFAFNLPVCATNDGAALTRAPVPATINADGLQAQGFVQNNFADLLAVNANALPVHLLAQDVDSDAARWWVEMDAIAAGQTRCWEIHMGNATASVDHGIFLRGASESVDIPHSADFNITSNLVLESLGTTLHVIPAAEACLVCKPGAYEFGVRNGNELFGRCHDCGGVDDLYDEGFNADFWVEGFSQNGGAQSKQSDHLRVSAGDGSAQAERTWVTDEAIDLTGVDTLEIDWLNLGGSGGANGVAYLVASTDKTAFHNTFDARIETFGSFARTTEQLSVSGLSGNHFIRVHARDACSGLCAAEVHVFRVTAIDSGATPAPVEISFSPLTLGSTHDYALTYASPSLDLWVDGVSVATATATGDIATNANDLTIGGGWTGSVEQTRVLDDESPILDLTYAPAHVSQTQEGNAGNSWTWEGDIADQSGESNDATYTFVRPYMADVTVAVQPLIAKAPLPSVLVVGELADTVGDLPGLTGTEDPVNFPGRDTIDATINFIGGPDGAAWFSFLVFAGIVLGGFTAWATGFPPGGLFVMGTVVGFGGPFGLFSWWLVAIVGFATFGTGGALALMGAGRR